MATRWATEHGPEYSRRYIERFRALAARGDDVVGEARLLDAMLARGSRVLDGGCGPGRVGAELAARGHTVVGVDADPLLIAAAQTDHPGPSWIVADLASLDLPAQGHPGPFDAAILAGNVMPYLEPGTETLVMAGLFRHVRPDGVIVIGFGTDRGYPLESFDEHAASAGLPLEQRFATWDLRPFHAGGDYAVSIFRRP